MYAVRFRTKATLPQIVPPPVKVPLMFTSSAQMSAPAPTSMFVPAPKSITLWLKEVDANY
ncbi:MAG: hypothetical protein IPL53_13550 [Ignavibacteria bacterium]|nr:hypothetical protein [Ignavibacteria bacterium]